MTLSDRTQQVVLETSRPRLRQRVRVVDQTGGCGEIRGGFETAHAPEIIPIGMHRMGEVAFVAGGFRQQAETGRVFAGAVIVGHALRPQRDQIVGGLARMGQHFSQEAPVAAVAEHLADAPEELAVAVVFDQPVDAVAVHHAGHEAVLALERAHTM